MKEIKIFLALTICFAVFNYASCKYSFKDSAPIPVEIKTFRVQYLENKAQYINTQLSQQLTENLKDVPKNHLFFNYKKTIIK